MFKRNPKTFHLNSHAIFSKKYPKKRVDEIFKVDPDYLLYCYEEIKVLFAEEVVTMLTTYKTQKEKRNIKRVTCFK